MNSSELGTLCGGCFQGAFATYAKVVSAFGGNDDDAGSDATISQVIDRARPNVDAWCSRDPDSGDFCLAEVGPVLLSRMNDDSLPSPRAAEALCSPCGRRITSTWISSPSDENAIEIPTNGCMKNPGGDRCITLFTGEFLDDLGEHCAPLLAPEPDCTESCKTALEQKANEAGCCFVPILKYMESTGNLPVDVDTLMNITQSQCGVTLSQCPPPSRKPASVRLTNVNFNWAIQNRATFEAKFKDDIAGLFVIDPSQVSVTDIRMGSVIVDFSVALDTEEDTTAATGILNESIVSGSLYLPATFQFINANTATAIVNPSLPIGVESDSSSDSASTASVLPLAFLLVATTIITM